MMVEMSDEMKVEMKALMKAARMVEKRAVLWVALMAVTMAPWLVGSSAESSAGRRVEVKAER